MIPGCTGNLFMYMRNRIGLRVQIIEEHSDDMIKWRASSIEAKPEDLFY